MEIRRLLSVVALAAVSAQNSDQQCPGYACLPSSDSMPASQCAQFSNSTIYLQPCSDDQFCNFTTGLCMDPDTDAFPIAFPGEPCSNSTQCLNENCVEGYCVGMQVNQTCAANTDCDPELYCHNKMCVSQLESGTAGCVSDFDCVNSAGCSSGVCVDYFSLSPGQPVEGCDDGFTFHNLCESFACYKGKCVGLVQSLYPSPVNCTTDFDCAGKTHSGKTTYFSECQCGFNPSGDSFCSLFPGDADVRNAKLCLKNWLFGEMSRQCNTERRFADYCIQSFWDSPNYDELTVYIYRANFYPKLVDNDECVMEMMTNFYWDFLDSHDDEGDTLRVMALAAVLALS